MKMKKKMMAATIAAMLLIGTTGTALAHDGWSQTNAPIIAQGSVSYVDLQLGNHSNDHKSYRITGQWSTDTSKVYVNTPDGKKVDITSTRYYTGEAATETEPAVNNGFIASFSASSPGAYIVTSEGDSIFKSGELSTRTLRSAKSFVAVSDIPLQDRVKALTGFAKAVQTDRAELVPLFNPAAVNPNEKVSIQLLLKGEPLANTEVSIIKRNNSSAEAYTTDENGEITFLTGLADYYLVRAKPSTAEQVEGEYSSINYEATMTFTVQNESHSLPVTNVSTPPSIYVNGKLVATDAVSIKAGTTYVAAAFVKQYIEANYKETEPAALRQLVESIGGTIEYLSSVNGTSAAVLVYTGD